MVILHDDGCTASDERIVVRRLSSAPFAGRRAALANASSDGTERHEQLAGSADKPGHLAEACLWSRRMAAETERRGQSLRDRQAGVRERRGRPILCYPAGLSRHGLPSPAAALHLPTGVRMNGTSVAMLPNSP